MSDPYLDYLVAEAERVENDLSSFRARSLTVLTTSSGVVGLITAAITFGSSKAEEDAGIVDGAIALLGLSIAAFIVATVLSLLINRSAKVQRPSSESLAALTTEATWNEDADEHERYVAVALAGFIGSMHDAIDTAATHLNWAIGAQIVGLVLGGTGGVVAALS